MATFSDAPEPHGRVLGFIGSMPAADFASVMSTGIVSIALHFLGYSSAAYMLFGINIVLYVLLACGHSIRFLRFPQKMRAEFTAHKSAAGFLSFTAASAVLGTQMLVLGNAPQAGEALFSIAVITWCLFLWGGFFGLFTIQQKPLLEHGINGAWLLGTVATQGLVILGLGCVAGSEWNPEVAYLAFAALFGLGIMLYILVITMIFYRFCFKPLEPQELSPTFWINAGAVAISTLAGTELILHAQHSALLRDILPFIKGLTLLAWGTASWWLPLLFLLGLWRHWMQKYPFTYSPEYWGMVFPMGMYTACTFMLSKAFDLPALLAIPRLFIAVAVLAWLLTFYGMVKNFVTKMMK